MNILMFTNTYAPHVGGVARSVQGFSREFRRLGHRVLVVAPRFEGTPANEANVVRLPAIQHFSGSDFSVPVPLPGRVRQALRSLQPQLIHSHHPFLLGDTALRIAAARALPAVFTHHTLYERYTHYLPGDSPRLRRFTIDLVSGYCNLCDAVIAPSRSLAELLRQRGVLTPIEVIPTGVDLGTYTPGEGGSVRQRLGIPNQAFVVGHVGRLAEEKNPLFLARATVRFMLGEPHARLLLAGAGPAREAMIRIFTEQGLGKRLHLLGNLEPAALVETYRAMDVFAFASQSETQGMVLTEAMATGTPVVAVDGPGVREVVRDRCNGRLLTRLEECGFAEALAWVAGRTGEQREMLRQEALETARGFAMEQTARKVLGLYQRLIAEGPRSRETEAGHWATARRYFGKEWKLLRNLAHAAEDALRSEGSAAEAKP
ncbi:glycosyl transferase family 1 [Desulfuromonas versatilis]|uniref:Glycosyl transferase family 1 n=1 Tax=Desulfuromonas versatilis TaxID=2802975 RepID=A0ABM8HP02_9BACT|nr:glycosyltransferase [Desulfuromonas versatilis]BCR03242.1 glycosyl transferase family 1 [Desulfuromonas versatilis]